MKMHLRNIVKAILGPLIILASLLALSGCGSDSPSSTNPDSLVPSSVEFRGNTYICIRYTTSNRGGLWCERESQ